MRSLVALALSLTALLPTRSDACMPMPGWRPPTVESAFRTAEVVLHAKVISVERSATNNVTEGRVAVHQVLKGKYSGDLVATGGGCGIGTLIVGRTYVFFFDQRCDWWVNGLSQPQHLSAEEMLAAIRALPKKDGEPGGRLVPAAEWDLPPFPSPLATVRLLEERERQYQESLRKKKFWSLWGFSASPPPAASR